MDKEAVRKEVIKLIESAAEGIMYDDIIKQTKAPEEITEAVINDVLSEGICYEPSPGKIRKI